MRKSYEFLNNKYESLTSIASAFSNNFVEAMDQISYNPKALIKFVKTKDKTLGKKIASIIANTKYKNNVITFIIYELSEDSKLIINNISYDFEKICETIRQYDAIPKHLSAFFEDYGLTRTIANNAKYISLKDDLIAIERNISNDFVISYLKEYNHLDDKETLNSYVPSLFVLDEKFKMASRLCKKEQFLLLVAKKYGVRYVIKALKETEPIFEISKLLINDFAKDDIARLTSDTFYIWLYNNYEKYDYQKEAKVLKSKFDALRKHPKENLSFDEDIDFKALLDKYYLMFSKYYLDGLITVNKNENFEMFALDKAYHNCYICADYIKNHPVVLKNDPIVIPQVSLDEQLDDELLNIKEAKTRGILRFLWTNSIISILAIIAIAIIVFINNDNKLNLDIILGNTYLLVGFIMPFIALILSVIFIIKVNSDHSKIIKYKRYNSIKNGYSYYAIDQIELSKLSSKELNYKKALNKNYLMSTFLIQTLTSICAGFGVALFINYNSNDYITVIISAILPAILSIIFKKKGLLYAIFMLIIATAVAYGYLFIRG